MFKAQKFVMEKLTARQTESSKWNGVLCTHSIQSKGATVSTHTCTGNIIRRSRFVPVDFSDGWPKAFKNVILLK